jgi:probable F420-dependent oxidoreductase
MEIGALIFPTDTGIQPIELAKELEARGYAALWVPEHSHIPTNRRTPWGGREGAPPLPPEYWRTHDQFVALTAAAAVTTTLKVATGITLVAQRDPIWLAKEVASLDTISGGRFMLGIGYGWNHEEMEHHGVDVKRRRAILREKMLACIELWTKDEASFDGDHVRFTESWSWPKPVQRPHPPIVLGGAPTDTHIRHLAEFCDAWMPIEGRWPIAEVWPTVQQKLADLGRDPATVNLGVFAPKADVAHLQHLREIGTKFVALGLPPLDRDAALRRLDQLQPLLSELQAS